MREEALKRLLLGNQEDLEIAMYWIFKNLDTNRRTSTFLKEYPVGDRRRNRTITMYNDKYMINNGFYHLVFSKSTSNHYKAMLTQTGDLIIKVEDYVTENTESSNE